MHLGPEGPPAVSPRCSDSHWTDPRGPVQLQVPSLVLIFLLVQSAVTLGRAMLLLGPWANPDAASMFQGSLSPEGSQGQSIYFAETQDEEREG